MASHVVVIEDSASGRMLLRSLLAVGYYSVSTVVRSQWREASPRSRPDLYIVGPTVADPLVLLDEIAAEDRCAAIPALVFQHDASPEVRLALISAGARDVLDYPVSEPLLRARIRNVTRGSEASRELARRQNVLASHGFSEAGAAFVARKPISLVRDRDGNQTSPDCGKAVDWSLTELLATEALSEDSLHDTRDGYVLDWRGTTAQSMVRQILPELRVRSHSRHAAILVLYDAADGPAAVHALDSGASDVVPSTADPGEIGYRISRMLSQKHVEDALRENAEESLTLAVTDALTGLYNRRYAERYLARLVENRQPDQPFALMMADIDRFKQINDGFGHAAGDAVLTEVAARLRSELRSMDLVARFGGEEFLIVLAESSSEQARLAANRLRRTIGRTPVKLPNGRTIDVTVSIGVSFCHAKILDNASGRFESDVDSSVAEVTELLSEADRALYLAKEQGRNQVRMAVNSA